MIKRFDAGLLFSFVVLLLFVLAIGAAGIYQIKALTNRVEAFANQDFPRARAVAGMKSSCGQYSMAVRGYAAWKLSRYLEAARLANSLTGMRHFIQEFDIDLKAYSQGSSNLSSRDIKVLKELSANLEKYGSLVICAVDSDDPGLQKQESVDRLLVDFDNAVYRLDGLLDKLQAAGLENVNKQFLLTRRESERYFWLLSWALIAALFLGIQIAAVVYSDRRKKRQREVDMVQDMIRFEERERQNLSFQVHNQMGQDLSALKMYMGILENKTGKLDELKESKNILNRLIDTMHDISELLCPPGLDEIGLLSMMESLIESYRKLTGAVFEFKKPQGELKISREYSLTIYRIAQEALNNIAKYSGAAKVAIALSADSDRVELRIQDDGVGFDYEGFLRAPNRRKTDRARLGILALKERAEILEGTMSIKTSPGQGVLIVVRLPCKR